MIEPIIVGGAGGIAATEVLDRVTESQEERILKAIEKCVDYIADCTRIIEQWGRRERERTPTMLKLEAIQGGTPARFNVPSTFRLETLIIVGTDVATAITIAFGSVVETFRFAGIAIPIVLPFPRTINGGQDVIFTVTSGAAITCYLYLVGYYERVSQMNNSDRPNA